MKALYCIHGILSSYHDFDNIVKNIFKYYDYIHLVNLPGHDNNKIPFTANNALAFSLNEFDMLKSKYDIVDILGYSLGGVIALYIQLLRPVNKLILIAPALKYINLKAYRPKEKSSNNLKLRDITPKKNNNRYLLTFVHIVHYVNNHLDYVYPRCLIILGKNDYLVKESSGYYIFNLCVNNDKSLIILDNINHFTIVNSSIVIDYISKFIAK